MLFTKLINMKRIILIAIAITIITATFSSCKKDYEKIKIQKHDENAMMDIMHHMMMEMDMMSPTNDPDHDFAMMMKMHHQGAIHMAEQELKEGENDDMKKIAQKIKDEQQAEIAQFDSFLAGHTPDTAVQEYTMKVMSAMATMTRTADLQVITGEADYDFASLMIPHHQSAIEMAQAVKEHGKHQEIKDMAVKIIDFQKKEIEELQNWLLNNKEY